MKTFSKTIILLLFVISVQANSWVDSLQRKLADKTLDRITILDTRLQLIKALNFNGKSDSLTLLCLTESEEIGDQDLIVTSKYYRARYLSRRYKDNDENLQLASFIDSMSTEHPEQKDWFIYARIANGKYLWLKRKYKEAASEYKTALDHAEKHGMTHEYFILHTNLASNQGLAKQFHEAIATSEASLKLKDAQPRFVYANLSDLYAQVHDWKNSLKCSKLLLKEAYDNDHVQAIFIGHVRIADAYKELGEWGKAENSLDSLIAQPNILSSSPSMINATYNSLIDVYIEKEEWRKGASLADSLAKIKVDKRYTYSTLAGKIGHCYLKMGNLGLAKKWCQDGKEVALNSGTRKFHYIPTVCNCLAEIYDIEGNYKLALENLKLVQESEEEFDEQAKIIDLSKALNELELKRQEEVLRLEQEQEQIKNQAKINRYTYLGIGGLLIAGITSFFVFFLRRRNREVRDVNSLLSKALSDKDLLLKEIHHRVKNNLQVISSLLSLQSRYVKDEKALSALNEGQNRVDSMALIHQNLYRGDNLSGVHMDKYIPQLADNVLSTYESSSERIQLKYDIDSIILDVSTVVPIGLVLNELVSNAMKYAFPENRKGTIQIGLHDHGEELELYVLDNGIGMPLNAEDLGFGSKLIKSFTRKLEGDLSITNENGTKVYLRIRNFKSASRDAFVESINQ